jgi:hypothetical protein
MVVLVVLTGAVAVASGLSGAGIANGVNSGVRRAICVAGGDVCADFHVKQPCAVAVDEDATSKGVSFGIWRIGKDRSLAVERRSDGSVTVTAYDDVEGGVGTSVGLRFGLGRAPRKGEGDEKGPIDLEARLRAGWGRSWEFADGPAAAAFLRRWAAKEPVRDPDVDRVRVGSRATASAAGELPLGLDASGSVEQLIDGEGTRDRRTGRTTVSLAVSRAVAGDLSGPLGLKLGGAVELEPAVTLITERELRPRELRLVGSLTTRDGTRRRDVQVRLDLTRPALREGLSGTLGGLLSGDLGRARSAAVGLGRWAADESWIDQREYRTDDVTDGPDVELALGFKLGFRDQESHGTERLVSALSRPPGGLWEDRTDCVGASS